MKKQPTDRYSAGGTPLGAGRVYFVDNRLLSAVEYEAQKAQERRIMENLRPALKKKGRSNKVTKKYLTKEDIHVFLDILERRKTRLDNFEENDHLNRRLATFHNETMDTVIAQFRQVLKEAGYVEEGATI